MANDISVAIQAAITKHQAGAPADAEQMYRNILSKTPEDAGVANLLGVALFQQNKLQEADGEIRHAIKLNPLEATFHFNLGNIAKALGKSEQAEDSYRNALKLKPYYPEATQNLCNLLEAQGRYEAASLLCREAIQLNARDINAHNKLVSLCETQGDWASAVAFYPKILALQPDNLEIRSSYAKALQNHAGLLLESGQCKASDSVYRQALEIDPAGLSALHILAAIENRSTQRAALDSIRELFDSQADEYEQHFQHRMGCDIPAKMHGLLTQLDSLKRYEILDMGCGTGLSGLAVRDLASRMVGVDLSPRMLEQARDKKIYAELHSEDVESYLNRTPNGAFDLIVSEDLFIHIGDLSDVFAKIARVLRPGGLFIFSTEETTAHSDEGYKPEATGRYTHRADYLHTLIRHQGYRILHFSQETIRMNGDTPVFGHLVMLQKNVSMSSAYPARPEENVRTEQIVREILSDHYANDASIQGWLFAALIDHRFFDSRLRRHPVQRRATHWLTCSEAADIDQATSDHLARISRLGDSTAHYAALEDLTLLNTPSLTQDSFSGLTETQCQQAIHQFFSGGRLNLVIIGAGPVGLVLASALKLALNTDANILLVENRVSSPHHKLPYERRWITNILSTCLQGLVEKSLSDIFARIGDGICIGCTLNELESLLLLSCRRLGVKFLFAESGDLAFIQDSPVQIVFDATGKSFQPISWPHSSAQITLRHNVETDLLGITDAQISHFGIKIHPCADNRHFTVGTYKNLIFPLHKNQPFKLAMLKLIHIPIRFYGALVSYIAQHNADNKYYVWPGTLQAEINQAIVIINLDKAEYDYLCNHHVFPMSLAEALQIEAFGASLDGRTGAILKLLAEQANEHDQIGIDAPFLFEPYLVNRAKPEHLYGRPLLHIGDSIYNGNVKCGNGLGPHLQHVRHIQKVLQKYAR